MSNHYPFRMTLTLRTPIIISNPIMLDSILAAAIFRQTNSVDLAHSIIPLKNTEGLWHGSGSTLIGVRRRIAGVGGGDPVLPQSFTFVRSLSLVRDAQNWVGIFQRYDESKGPYNRSYGKDSDLSCYKPRMDTYTAYTATRVEFDGFGDGEACRDLLAEHIHFIGAKSSYGHGEISYIDLEQTEEDVSIVNDGYAARNIPLSQASNFGNPRGLTMTRPWKPRYWGGEAVKCVCQPSLVPVKIL